MTEMYVCSKEKVGDWGVFFLMRKKVSLTMAATNIMIFDREHRSRGPSFLG